MRSLLEYYKPNVIKHSNDLTSNDEVESKNQRQMLMMDHKIPSSDLIRKKAIKLVENDKTCTPS